MEEGASNASRKKRKDSPYKRRDFNFNQLPMPIVRNLIGHIRYHEFKNLQEAVDSPIWYSYSSVADTIYKTEIRKYDSFLWTRHKNQYIGNEHMAPRAGQSTVYHDECNAMFIFGGRSVTGTMGDDSDHACFNDLWRLDLVTRKMTRIVVRSTPYPLPKYAASMVLYKGDLLLFGGRRPSPPYIPGSQQRMHENPNADELHSFDVKRNAWREMTTFNECPSLAGHSAIMCGDLLVTFGGTLGHGILNTTFRVLNMRTLRWFTPNLPGVPETINSNAAVRGTPDFPVFEVGSTSLIELKPGHVLLLGEQRPTNTQNYGVIVSYDIANPEDSIWRWQRIPVAGKWWYEIGNGPNGEGPLKPRNSNFPKVVPLYTNNAVRLVTVGLPEAYFRRLNTVLRCSPELEPRIVRQAHFVDGVIKVVRSHLEKFRTPDEDQDAFTFSAEGLCCHVQNVVSSSWKTKLGRPRRDLHVTVEFDFDCPVSGYEYDLDEIDLGYMECAIRKAIYQWNEYYKGVAALPPNFPLRPRFFRPACIVGDLFNQGHLATFTSLISLGDGWTPDQLAEIKYTEGDSHRHAAPPFINFTMCAGRAEVIMHGGEKDIHMPTVTYVMTPASRAPVNSKRQPIPDRYKMMPILYS